MRIALLSTLDPATQELIREYKRRNATGGEITHEMRRAACDYQVLLTHSNIEYLERRRAYDRTRQAAKRLARTQAPVAA